MSDTPRTDAALESNRLTNDGSEYVPAVVEYLCRDLERELAEAHRVISETVTRAEKAEKRLRLILDNDTTARGMLDQEREIIALRAYAELLVGALRKIEGLTDLEMADGDGAREIARAALAKNPNPAGRLYPEASGTPTPEASGAGGAGTVHETGRESLHRALPFVEAGAITAFLSDKHERHQSGREREAGLQALADFDQAHGLDCHQVNREPMQGDLEDLLRRASRIQPIPLVADDPRLKSYGAQFATMLLSVAGKKSQPTPNVPPHAFKAHPDDHLRCTLCDYSPWGECHAICTKGRDE